MNSANLKAEIARAGKTNRSLAALLGMSEQTLYNKITGKTEFKSSEILILARELSLSMQSVNDIFFDKRVN